MDLTSLKVATLMQKDRVVFLVNKNSPEILLVSGVLGIVTSTVLACRATIKAQSVVEEAKVNFDMIKNAHALPESYEYSDEDYIHDRTLAFIQTTAKLAQLYGPSLVIGAISLGMLVGSNRILNRRNAALIGAFKAVDEAYKAYRKRVRDELGVEVDDYLRFRKEYDGDLKVVDGKIKAKATKLNDVEVDLPGEIHDGLGMPSPYAVFFDASSPQWRQTNDLNEFFLKAQQNFANDLLESRGHVFLNEVLDMLGIPRTQEGSVVGWVKKRDDSSIPGDGYVDFDIYNPFNSKNRDFINNYQQDALFLDFNVDGVIFDQI